MEHAFWHSRWESNQIGFHAAQENPLLVRHIGALSINKGARVFLPLCGKSLDIHWLLARGFQVAGIELSDIAVKQLFEDLNLNPVVREIGSISHYSAENIDIFAGDIFDLTPQTLGPIDAIYDRAALVALPATMRPDYAAQLAELGKAAPQLVICFEYDQSAVAGPPFSIDAAQMHALYSAHYRLTDLETVAVPNGLKGIYPATETAWLLTRS